MANGKLRVLGLGPNLLLLELSGLHLLPELLLELLLSELPQLFGIRVFSRADGITAVGERELKGEDVAGNNVSRALRKSLRTWSQLPCAHFQDQED